MKSRTGKPKGSWSEAVVQALLGRGYSGHLLRQRNTGRHFTRPIVHVIKSQNGQEREEPSMESPGVY